MTACWQVWGTLTENKAPRKFCVLAHKLENSMMFQWCRHCRDASYYFLASFCLFPPFCTTLIRATTWQLWRLSEWGTSFSTNFGRVFRALRLSESYQAFRHSSLQDFSFTQPGIQNCQAGIHLQRCKGASPLYSASVAYACTIFDLTLRGDTTPVVDQRDSESRRREESMMRLWGGSKIGGFHIFYNTTYGTR